MTWVDARIAALSIVTPVVHGLATIWNDETAIGRELRVIANGFAKEAKALRLRRSEGRESNDG